MKKSLIPILIAVLMLSSGCSPAATPAPSSLAEAEDTATLQTLEIPALPDGVELIEEVKGENGISHTRWLYDSMVLIESTSVECTEANVEDIATQIEKLNGNDTSDFYAAIDDTMSQKFTYPVWRISYYTGSNEDTRTNVDIYIQTDSMDYWFHTSTPSDFYEDYEESIETWIASLAFAD